MDMLSLWFLFINFLLFFNELELIFTKKKKKHKQTNKNPTILTITSFIATF